MKARLIRTTMQSVKRGLRTTRGVVAIVAGLLVLAVLPLVIWQLRSPSSEVAAAWFDASYQYRKILPISNSGGGVSNYQMMLTVDTSALISAGKMQSDCDDIRMTNISGKLLSIWIEPGTCNTTTTLVWVKVDSISGANNNIYFYYGNPSATSVSSTTGVFIREIKNVVLAFNFDEASYNGTTGEASDRSGNNNNGTAVNGATTASGKFNNAVTLDGTNDYLSLAAATSLPTGSNVRTMLAWIKPDVYSTQTVFSYGTENAYQRSELGIRSASNYVVAAYNNVAYGTSSVPAAGNWYLAVVTLTGTTASTTQVYVDGTSYTATLQAGADSTVNTVSNGVAQIGTGIPRNASFFDGQIDDLRVYNRVLSAAEISDLYGSGSNRQGYVTPNYPGVELVRVWSTNYSFGALGTEEVTPGPTGLWKLDEGQGQTINDASGNQLSGVLGTSGSSASDDPSWQTPDQCVFDKCLYFDGSNDLTTISDNAKLEPTGSLSVGGWVKLSALPSVTGEDATIVYKRHTSSPNYSYKLDVSTTNQFRFGWSITGTAYTVTAPTTAELNRWYYIEGTRNGTTLKIYVNGVLAATNASGSSSNTLASDSYLSFGAITTTTGRLKGFIDQPQLYAYERTAAQVAVDYNNGAARLGYQPQTTLSSGLVGYWKTDESSGTAADSSGVGNTLTNNGTTTYTAGKYGRAATFNGSSQYLSTANTISSVRTISFWANPAATTNYYLNLASGVYITSSSGTLSATGVTSPTIYVNGLRTSTIAASTWSHVTITTETPITVNALEIGRANGSYATNTSRIDETRLYNRTLAPNEVTQLYGWAAGPSIWWKLDDNTGTSTAADSSGGGYNGTLNSITAADWVPGKKGSALQLDGTNDYVSLADNAVLTPNTISFELWFNLDVTASSRSENHTLVEHEHGPSPFRAYDLFIDSSSNRLTGGVYNQSGTGVFLQGNDSIAANTWYHAAITWDGTTARLYLNGNQVSSSALSGTSVLDGNGALTVGDGDAGFGFETDGKIDDFRLYHYARTQAQIIEDMNADAVMSTQSTLLPEPVAYWKLDEQTGQTINNSGTGGSTLNGTLGANSSGSTDDPTWNQAGGGTCKMNACLDFDGTTDYANVPDSTLMQFGTGDFTASAWIYPHTVSYGGADQGTIISKDYLGFELFVYQGKLHAYVGGIPNTIQGVRAININTWYHVAVTRVNGTLTTYINGIPDVSLTNTASASQNGTAVNIGGRTGNATLYFDGVIDNVTLYAQGLNAAQIGQDMNAGGPQNFGATAAAEASLLTGGAGTPPVAYWKLDENTGTTANDSSGNSLTGTLTGNPTWAPAKLGAGVNFDGVSDYISVADNSLLEPTNDISIDFWVYQRSSASTEGKDIVYVRKAHSVSPFQSYQIYQQQTGNTVCFLWYNTTPTGYTVCTVHSLTTNTWNHIHAVKSGSTLKIYLNGADESSSVVTPTGTMYNSNGVLSLGDDNGGNKELTGIMDNVRIYAYGRSPAQIAYDYNRGLPQYFFNFDACQGSNIGNSYPIPNQVMAASTSIGASGTQTTVGNCQQSGTAWGNGVNGKFNSSLNFDGTDDLVSAGTGWGLYQDTTPFSVSAWIKTTGATQSIISKWTVSSSPGWRVDMSSGQIRMLLVSANGSAGRAIATTGTYNDGNWKHVVATYDGSGSSAGMRIYVNGFQVATSSVLNTSPGTLSDTAVNIAATQTSTTPTLYFSGQIDELGVYSYMLTADQVKIIMNQGGGARFGPTTGIP